LRPARGRAPPHRAGISSSSCRPSVRRTRRPIFILIRALLALPRSERNPTKRGSDPDRSVTGRPVEMGAPVTLLSRDMGDMHGAEPEVLRALEGDITHVGEAAVSRRVHEAGAHHGRALPTVRDQPQDRLQVARALPRRLRARRPVSTAPSQPRCGRRLARGCHRASAQAAPSVGTEEAPRRAPARQP